jgi:NAD(P)-dependent dehydrogenase (short-subunit alcohol dehydrogenase family)
MNNKTNKKIVITGVTRGLGRALVEKFSELGHTLIGCGRTQPIIAEMNEYFGKPHDFDVVDVTDDNQVAAWSRRILTNNDPPDLLINNAALINKNALLWEISAKEFDAIIDVNLKGVANVIRHFVPAMVARQSGVIVNLSSGWGRTVEREEAPYCCTKWGIEGLTQALALELPEGMAAIPLSPGIINTDMLRTCLGEQAVNYQSAEEWAESAAPFLLKLNAQDNGKPMSIKAG